jgi:hypothetical protein
MPVGLEPTGISGTFTARGWTLIAKTDEEKAPDIFCSKGRKLRGTKEGVLNSYATLPWIGEGAEGRMGVPGKSGIRYCRGNDLVGCALSDVNL